MEHKELPASEPGLNDLQQLHLQNTEEIALLRKQLRMTQILTFSSLAFFTVILVLCLIFIPKLTKAAAVLENADFANIVRQIEDFTENGQVGFTKAMETIDSMDIDTLNEAIEGLKEMASQVQEFTVNGQEGFNQALAKLDQMDIEKLNDAIEDLHAVIEPLAKLFKR